MSVLACYGNCTYAAGQYILRVRIDAFDEDTIIYTLRFKTPNYMQMNI